MTPRLDHSTTCSRSASPRDPRTWVTVTARDVPAWHLDKEALAKGLSGLGKSMGQAIIDHAR